MGATTINIPDEIDREFVEHVRWQETLEALEAVAHGGVAAEEDVHKWLRSWGTAGELPPPTADR